MEEFSCDMFELEFRVRPEQFDKEAFLAEVRKIDDRDTDVREYAYGSSLNPDKQHAHIIIDLHRAERFRFRIIYYNHPGDSKDTEPPYMEECAQWLGRFFKNDEIQGTLHALYSFDDQYSPVVPLPFPLVAASAQLAGSKVTGLALQLPVEMGVQRAILQRGRKKDETSVQIDAKTKLKLSEFNLTSQLERFAVVVMTLVNPVDKKTEQK
jgi:hypothetical protein